MEVVHLVPNNDFRPGVYTVRTTLSDGQNTTIEESQFAWGVLAVNLRRSIEHPNTKTQIGMAVLDDTGYALCDAQVQLEVVTWN